MQYESDPRKISESSTDAANSRLGSMRPDDDPIEASTNTVKRYPTEFVAAEAFPTEKIPAEGLEPEFAGGDLISGDTRPHDLRPNEFFTAEGR